MEIITNCLTFWAQVLFLNENASLISSTVSQKCQHGGSQNFFWMFPTMDAPNFVLIWKQALNMNSQFANQNSACFHNDSLLHQFHYLFIIKTFKHVFPSDVLFGKRTYSNNAFLLKNCTTLRELKWNAKNMAVWRFMNSIYMQLLYFWLWSRFYSSNLMLKWTKPQALSYCHMFLLLAPEEF